MLLWEMTYGNENRINMGGNYIKKLMATFGSNFIFFIYLKCFKKHKFNIILVQ